MNKSQLEECRECGHSSQRSAIDCLIDRGVSQSLCGSVTLFIRRIDLHSIGVLGARRIVTAVGIEWRRTAGPWILLLSVAEERNGPTT